MKHKLAIAIILALIFILGIAALAFATPSPVGIQGGYAYGAVLGDYQGGSAVLRAGGGIPSETEGRIGESELCEGLVQKLASENVSGESRGLAQQPQDAPTSNVTVRYIIAKPFQSLDELNAFLDYYREHKRIVFVANGQKLSAIAGNCKEMAKDLQDMAAKQGYDFPTETLTQVEMYKIYGKWVDRPHRINKAWIPGVGEWYYDFNTDRLWRVW